MQTRRQHFECTRVPRAFTRAIISYVVSRSVESFNAEHPAEFPIAFVREFLRSRERRRKVIPQREASRGVSLWNEFFSSLFFSKRLQDNPRRCTRDWDNWENNALERTRSVVRIFVRKATLAAGLLTPCLTVTTFYHCRDSRITSRQF